MTSYQHSFDNSFSDSLRRKRDETTDGYLKSVLDVYLDDAREFNKNNPSADDTDFSNASYDQVIKQSVLKRHGIEGTWDPETQSYDEDTENKLYAQMKFNPAATPENFKEAFGICDESGCYWPEEIASSGSMSGWGGGRQQGSGKGVTRENMSPLGLGFSLGQFGRNVAARFSPTQGKVGGGKKNKATKGGRTAPGGNDGKSQSRGAMRSDIQLKENITYINQSPNGHSIYEWNYKGEPESRRYQGVMAQELLQTAPEAVVTMDNGYLGVDYEKIDVDFTTA